MKPKISAFFLIGPVIFLFLFFIFELVEEVIFGFAR